MDQQNNVDFIFMGLVVLALAAILLVFLIKLPLFSMCVLCLLGLAWFIGWLIDKYWE